MPPYLTAAAAMKSRAFPAFTYDANAGTNWATRFSFENNRNPDSDWPVEDFEYADEELQRVQERVRFTYADFVLCDRRHAHHFAVVPRERWTTAMVPAADWLALPERDAAERVPYVLAVDGRRPAASRDRRFRDCCRPRAGACCCGTGCRSTAASTTRMPSRHWRARRRPGKRRSSRNSRR